MRKQSWMLLGMMVAVGLWTVTEAQAQERIEKAAALDAVHRSVDGSSSTVLRSGKYRVASLVGQSVAGSLTARSGAIWHMHQRAKAQKEQALLQEAAEIPADYALASNYPNPFNPNTVIEFAIPESGRVQLFVYDVLGREVARLVDGDLAAGRHSVVFDARGLASGIYLYRMEAGKFTQHRTMLLMK